MAPNNGNNTPRPDDSFGRSPYDDPRAYARQQRAQGQAQPQSQGQYQSQGQSQGQGACPNASAGAAGQPSSVQRYPVGSGRVYESMSRGAVGVNHANQTVHPNPASSRMQANSPYGGGEPPRGKSKSRRAFIAAAGVAVAGLVGFVGFNWYTHRAVACTVNGTEREAPVNSTPEYIVKLGYANPRPGNLVSICVEGETPAVLQEGGGEPYTMTVNGQPVDPASYKLGEGDVIEFTDGGDVVEQTTCQNTEIPFAAQVPQDGSFLVKIGYVAQWGQVGLSTVETGNVSGRVIDRGVTREPQDFIIACAEHINPADGRRLIALTFDDGPDLTYTPQYLDILANYGAHATFFNLGSSIDIGPEYQALSKRCVEEGHQVASHTYSHSNLLQLSADACNEELSKSFEAVSNATGVQTNVMRPPYGNFYGSTFLNYLYSGGDIAYSAYWGIDSEDWSVATNGSGIEDGGQQIVEKCTTGISKNPDDYSGGIILMHDGGGNRDRDVAALPGIIQTFLAYGFELVTLDELLAACGTFPEWVTSGYATRPEGARLPDESTVINYYDPYYYDPLG